jgi:hypothetical protein
VLPLLPASTRLCADGGANRLYDQLPSMLPNLSPEAARLSCLPDLIKGDMDSVRKDVRSFYLQHNVALIDLSSDQDTTDLTKCLLHIEQKINQLERDVQTLGCSTPSPGPKERRSRSSLPETGLGARGPSAVVAATAENSALQGTCSQVENGPSAGEGAMPSRAAGAGSGEKPDVSAATAAVAAGPGRPLAYDKHRVMVLGEFRHQKAWLNGHSSSNGSCPTQCISSRFSCLCLEL